MSVGEIIEVNGVNTRKDGRPFSVQLRICKLDDEYAMANVRDITGRNQHGEKPEQQSVGRPQQSRDSEQRLLQLLNSTSEGIYGLDLAGNCTFCNPSCLQLLGYSNENQLLGKNMHELMHHTTIDGRPHPKEDCKIYRAFQIGKGTHVDDEVLWRADGTSFEAEYRSFPIEQDGKISGSVVTFVDNSQRKIAERELSRTRSNLQAIMDYSSDVIILMDEAGTIQLANKTSEKLFEYKLDELVGKSVTLLMSKLNADKHSHSVQNYITNSNSKIVGAGPIEVVGVTKSGEEIQFDLSVDEVKIGDRNYFVGNLRDIRDRKIERSQLLQMQKLDSIGKLSSGIAHDFNNLLTAIMGNLDLLTLYSEDERQLRSIKAALTAAKRGSELTRRLLSFSKKQSIAPVICDINDSVIDVAEMVKVSLGSHIEFIQILSDQAYTTLADKSELENALMNLCINARDAMPKGGMLTVSTSNKDIDERLARKYHLTPGAYVSILVEDTGIGMSQTVQQQAIEPFFTTKDAGKGSGLGLSMVYGTMEQFGGCVFIESEVGKGSKIELLLPHVAAEASDAADSTTIEESLPRPSRELELGTILIIDDDRAVLNMTAEIVRNIGYSVFTALDGKEAVELVQAQEQLNFVLCDVMLAKGERGLDLVKQITSLRPAILPLFMSGYANSSLEEHGEIAKIGLINKPFSISELRQRLSMLGK